MIYDDGLVYDVSVTDESLQDINLLMKLPKSEQYFGYSDEKGVVYFIHRWFSVGICRVINHKTCYKFSALIG